MRRFVGNLEFGRHGLIRLRSILGIVYKFPDQSLAIARHAIDQFLGKEAGSL